MQKKNGSSTFIKITNNEIYKEILYIKTSIDNLNESIKVSNEKIKSNRRSLSTLQKLVLGAYGFSLAILGFLISYIISCNQWR